MNHRTKLSVVVLLGVCAAQGCATNQEAQDLARESLVQVMEYENALKAVDREMRGYYRKMAEDLESAVAAQHETAALATLNQLATDNADKAMDQGFRAPDFRAFLTQYVEEKRQGFARTAEALDALRRKHSDAKTTVASQTAGIKAVRGRLETLQTQRSIRKQIELLKTNFDHARDVLKNLEAND